ncbi:MAG: GGDEF domain-containing protein [Lachnospiraceae bacterium]|nr:GGDEF domain-containing protein [Candidatus Merdinaster equi]
MEKRIAVCMARIEESIPGEALCSICKIADDLGYGIQLLNTFEDLGLHNLYDEGEKSIFGLLNPELICGVILFPETIKDDKTNRKIIDFCKEKNIPIVCVDRNVPDCHSVTFGYEESFEQIVEHLITVHDCKTFYMMAGIRNNSFSEERIDAARRVIERHGLKLRPQDVGYGDFWEIPTRENILQFLDSGRPLPDAFIAANDAMAITIITELMKAGYRVPEDVIVTGFDGIEMEKYVLPRLTTAQQDIPGGMKRAVEYIDAACRGEEEKERLEEVPFSVRYSMSCGCESIPQINSAKQVHQLYCNLTDMEIYFKHIFETQVTMNAEKTFLDMIRNWGENMYLMNNVRSMYVIFEPRVLENDEKILKILAEKEQSGVVRDKDKDKLIVVAQYNDDGRGMVFPITVFDRKQILPDYARQDKFGDKLCFVPLHVQDYVIGYMCVDIDYKSDDSRFYTINYMARLLSNMADDLRRDQKAEKVKGKLKLANDKLEELYVTDPLTGIFNRRGFFAEIKGWIKKKKGYVCMISVDLDLLKQINDNYGHSEGDFAIKTIAMALKSSVEGFGLCARFGGDEFSAAIFAEDSDTIDRLVQEGKKKFYDYIDNVNLTAGKSYPINASCGVAIGELSDTINIDQLLNIADEKMYDDKLEHHKLMRGRSKKRQA